MKPILEYLYNKKGSIRTQYLYLLYPSDVRGVGVIEKEDWTEFKEISDKYLNYYFLSSKEFIDKMCEQLNDEKLGYIAWEIHMSKDELVKFIQSNEPMHVQNVLSKYKYKSKEF